MHVFNLKINLYSSIINIQRSTLNVLFFVCVFILHQQFEQFNVILRKHTLKIKTNKLNYLNRRKKKTLKIIIIVTNIEKGTNYAMYRYSYKS